MALPTLRRELVTAFALVFACAVLIVATGVMLIVSVVETPRQATVYLILLLLADVAIFTIFGRYLTERRLVTPIETMIDRIETVAHGDYAARVPESETRELARLGTAVNRMAERLIHHQQQLEANIRSLDETNRALTEARDAVVRAEKMASVGRLGAGIAHEVGNPLGAILGYLGILAKHVDPSKKALVDAAESEAQRIDRIVRGLLEYARPRETKPQPIDVNAVVTDTLELMRTQGRFLEVEVVIELGDDLPPVLADPYQLQQVLVNLLVNATDAMNEGSTGAMSIRTSTRAAKPPSREPVRRRDDPPGIDYSHRRRFHFSPDLHADPMSPTGQLVELAVEDCGPGIDEELLDQIFEPFVTTKEPGKGTGLGLAVCARLIESMGGAIRADSEPGRGTTFTVILPAAVPQPAIVGR